jgi:hypothetical protein
MTAEMDLCEGQGRSVLAEAESVRDRPAEKPTHPLLFKKAELQHHPTLRDKAA